MVRQTLQKILSLHPLDYAFFVSSDVQVVSGSKGDG